ncbi:hypothetical protein C8Q74DRAFT_1214036 [Fomes fomentarius]|nr:hypothetical protein C8Q74DRAFT_1214036 [Fomes fomentarius]
MADHLMPQAYGHYQIPTSTTYTVDCGLWTRSGYAIDSTLTLLPLHPHKPTQALSLPSSMADLSPPRPVLSNNLTGFLDDLVGSNSMSSSGIWGGFIYPILATSLFGGLTICAGVAAIALISVPVFDSSIVAHVKTHTAVVAQVILTANGRCC